MSQRRISTLLRSAPTRYRPLERIAVGGMAEVWRAEAMFEDGASRTVAIKRVLPKMGDPLFRSMFEDEARLGMRLRHPNVVRVYDARDVSGTLIMVMELVDGDSLKGLIDRAWSRHQPMPVPTALHVVRELVRALEYVHNALDEEGMPLGIVHRDISPHNLLLGRDGAVKLMDFGLADANVHANARSKDLVGGKLGYLAPEVVRQRPADHRVDLFAAGIVLWELLAGRRLFQGTDDAETVRNVARCQVPSLRQLNPEVPAPLEGLLTSLLHTNPEKRPPNASRLLVALSSILDRVDPHVSSRDVSLMVALHLAFRAREAPVEVEEARAPLAVADLLAEELAEFAEQTTENIAPLDPNDFARADVRTRPNFPPEQ
ncbi:MAG: serine/threonine-protein kinase [Myxococcota bacterium]